jgi:hypothetical protein
VVVQPVTVEPVSTLFFLFSASDRPKQAAMMQEMANFDEVAMG